MLLSGAVPKAALLCYVRHAAWGHLGLVTSQGFQWDQQSLAEAPFSLAGP